VSSNAASDRSAFRELEQLVRHLGDELAQFRRRALQAEARVKELESATQTETPEAAPVASSAESGELVRQLTQENAELKSRLAGALERTSQLGERVRFLRQQTERGGER
jgi:chromosome segregation ATPase